MRVISVNVGQLREVMYLGRTVATGIFKEPVEGRVVVRTLNLNGDKQADLSVHGGPNKAVYAYPAEHYTWWQKQLGGIQLPYGAFGENITTEGLHEQDLRIGDQFRFGSANFIVTQPRLPCYKLEIRFGRDDMIKRFTDAGRPGFYLRVLREGEVGAGDTIERISRDDGQVTVSDIFRLIVEDQVDFDMLRRALRVKSLPERLQHRFQNKLELFSKQ